ncbi:MAG: aminoglycoside phosphotransferase family protein [Gemmatimonadota bacterium]
MARHESSPPEPPVHGAYATWVPDDLEEPPREVLELAARLAVGAARGPVHRVDPILGRGVVNWVVLAEAGEETVVARISREVDDPSALEVYEKEAWCLEHAGAIGLPGPRALSTGVLDGRAYMVMTYVPGEPGATVPMDVLGVWKELGGYAARIAQIPARGFGNVLVDAGRAEFRDSFHASWRDRIEYNIEHLVRGDPLVRLGVYEREHRERIHDHFRALLMEEWRLALCHGDLDPSNTIVDGAGDVHLMDWGSAAVDVWPEAVVADVRRLLYLGRTTPAAVGWFLDGLGLRDASSARFRTRVERVMLLRAFDRVRWALDRGTPRLHEIAGEAYQLWHGLRLGSHAG